MHRAHAHYVIVTLTQVCAALRVDGVTIPIFAVTGNVDPRSIEVFKRSGFDGILAKPYLQADVVRLLARARALLHDPVVMGRPRGFWNSLEASGNIGVGASVARCQQTAQPE